MISIGKTSEARAHSARLMSSGGSGGGLAPGGERRRERRSRLGDGIVEYQHEVDVRAPGHVVAPRGRAIEQRAVAGAERGVGGGQERRRRPARPIRASETSPRAAAAETAAATESAKAPTTAESAATPAPTAAPATADPGASPIYPAPAAAPIGQHKKDDEEQDRQERPEHDEVDAGRRRARAGGAKASVESVIPYPRAIMPARALTPLSRPAPYSSRASSGPITSRRMRPASASVTIPSSPRPTSIRTCPVPG